MAARYRAGVVGAGSWARAAHIPGFQSCPDVDLVAICDIDRDLAERVATERGVPRVYASATAMLAQERLDLVSVVTPDDAHLADAGAAIAAGAHVLCEKPLATAVADARALAEAAAQAGVKTALGFALRFAPALLRLRELVASGEIGEPRLLQAFQQNGQFLNPATPFHWKMDRARTGGGAIVEYGIHTLDLARWIMGEATRVCATGRTWTPERELADGSGLATVEVDDSTAWLMEFADGAIAACHAGWSTVGRPPGIEVRVFGSRGAVRCLLSDELPGAEGLWLAGPDGHFQPVELPSCLSQHMPETGGWAFQWPAHLIRRFVSSLTTEDQVIPTFADGVRAQELLAAVLLSMEEDRWVRLPSA